MVQETSRMNEGMKIEKEERKRKEAGVVVGGLRATICASLSNDFVGSLL